MKDTHKILRKAVYDSLTGNITQNSVNVPVFDETKAITSSATLYILLTSQSEGNQDVSETFITESAIDFEIVDRREFSASKDDVDDVYQSVMDIIFPSTTTLGISEPTGFQFLNGRRDSSYTQSVSISQTETILKRITRLVFTIIQK